MLDPCHANKLRYTAADMLRTAGVVLRHDEVDSIELAEFGLDEFEIQGLAIVVYTNSDRYCAKELVMLPNQTCPQHKHPPAHLPNNRTDPGKQETFRCRHGTVWLYVEGPGERVDAACSPPSGSKDYYTVFHEIELHPGDQYTIPPNTLHWFATGADGAVVSEFSSPSRDELDDFTDPRICRVE